MDASGVAPVLHGSGSHRPCIYNKSCFWIYNYRYPGPVNIINIPLIVINNTTDGLGKQILLITATLRAYNARVIESCYDRSIL